MKNPFITNFARNFVFPFVVKIGFHKLIFNSSNGILNIYFHGVSPTDFTNVSGRHMQIDQFISLIKYLKNSFEIISMEESYSLGKPYTGKGRLISIGFDDGYFNNFKYLPEIAQRYKIPFTIFVCGVAIEKDDYLMWTDQIALMRHFLKEDYVEIEQEKFFKSGRYDLVSNSGESLYQKIKKMTPSIRENYLSNLNLKYNTIEISRDFDEDYWKLMNSNHLKELQNTGLFEIASHGMYHYNLSNISVDAAKQDMKKSIDLLEKTLGKRVDSISFPDGSYNSEVISSAKSIELEKLWISEYNRMEDKKNPNLRSRFGISSTTNHYSNIISIHKAFKSYGI